jgi:mRNA interferase RelE/StbE
VTHTIVWLPEARSAFRRLRAADPVGARQVSAAVGGLAGDPYPAGSTSLGGSGFHRLRLDNYRVLYEVDTDAVTVFLINVGSLRDRRQ